MADARQLYLDPDPELPQVLAVAPFGQWKYEDAHKAMQEAVPTDYITKWKYCVDHDHFQDGNQWVGPGDATVNEKIETQFAPDDAIGAVLDNVENAFSEPQIGMAPVRETGPMSDAMQRKIEEASSLLSDWWDKRNLQELIQDRVRASAWAGWGTLRLWIPWRYLLQGADGITIRPASSIEQALNYIHVMAPNPKSSVVIVDEGTRDQIAIFLDTEYEWVDGEQKSYERAELVYLDPLRENDEDADTIVRVVYANQEKPEMQARLTVGGRLLVSEMRGKPIITDPVMRTQNQLNLLTSLITRIGETAAFRERYTMNAKPQGIRIPYEDGDTLSDGAFVERDDEGRQWQVIPQARTLGANTTTELIGLPQYDDRGDAKGNQMPNVLIVDPVDPSPYNQAAEDVRKRIMRMCAQGHLASGSNAEVSGIAYEQARAVFEKDLKKRKVALEGMLRSLLTAALRMAEEIAGVPGQYTNDMRITVDQHVYAGPRSPDLVRLDLEAVDAGVMAEETAMSRMGIEDTEAEKLRISRSVDNLAKIFEGLATGVTVFEPQGMQELLRQLGVPQEIVATLVPKEEPEPVEQPIGEAAPQNPNIAEEQ